MLKKVVRMLLLLLAGAAAGRLVSGPERLWRGGRMPGEDDAADVLVSGAVSYSSAAPTWSESGSYRHW